MWILLTVGNAVVCFVCFAILWCIRRNEQQEVLTCIERIQQLTDNKADSYIWIHYSHEAYKELDSLLSAIPSSVVVVFQAPAWLQMAKKKKWEEEGHLLIPADPQLIPSSFRSESRLVMVRGNRYDIFPDPVAFLKLYALPELPLNRTEDLTSSI